MFPPVIWIELAPWGDLMSRGPGLWVGGSNKSVERMNIENETVDVERTNREGNKKPRSLMKVRDNEQQVT